MNFEERLNALSKLGAILKNIGEGKEIEGYSLGITESEYNDLVHLVNSVSMYNGWFTPKEVKRAFLEWGSSLNEENLKKWMSNYDLNKVDESKTVGIIMAGNIPLVGFHDFLSAYILGMSAKIKMSSDDNKLFPHVLNILSLFDDEVKTKMQLVFGTLKEFDAVIATGSNNTSKYFEQYFGKYPNIIRKSRTSVAIISGNETEEQLGSLAEDVFAYYGLGCRNITKVYVPKGYDLNNLFKAFFPYQYVVDNNKYANNYDYHKAVFLMEKYDIIENGFLLVREDKSIHSPIGSLNYEYYEDLQTIEKEIDGFTDELQCVVGSDKIPFGNAQSPKLWDYADNVDTIEFLLGL